MLIKHDHLHRILEYDDYLNQKQLHDLYSIQQYSADALNFLHLCHMFQIYQQMYHLIGKPIKKSCQKFIENYHLNVLNEVF